jgi:hypothetical protein
MSELVNENTRLSADLLEQQINSEKEFKQLLSREQSRWVQRTADKDRELDELKKRIERFIIHRLAE